MRQPFSVVRNPIYSAMVGTFAGIALVLPNLATIAGVLVLLVALERTGRSLDQ